MAVPRVTVPRRDEDPTRLPFTVIDEVVHLLDTPAEPWSIELEMQVSGRLDELRLRRAVAQALARHPMARARMWPARGSDRHYYWEVTAWPDLDPFQVVHCGDDLALAEAREQLQSRSVPLGESPPLRVLLAHHAGGDVVMLNVHHTAFDGIGTLRLLRSIAGAYAGEHDRQPEVDLSGARDLRRQLAAPNIRTRVERWRLLAGELPDLVVPPARLAREQGVDRVGYGFQHRSLSAQHSAALAAGGHGVTLNDLLLAALHATAEAWNAEHGTPCRRIGVLVPVNLRPMQWRQEVATNFVLLTRILTTRQDRQDTTRLLEAMAAQTARIKKWGGGAALVEVLGGLSGLPVWAKRVLAPMLRLAARRMACTAVLTNLGTIKETPSFGRDGGAPVGLWFSSPTQLPCSVSVGALTLDDRLHLSFRYRHPVFGPDAARRFADCYLVELDRLAAESAD